MQNGLPIAYASRALSQCEQRYAQIEKECLAIVYACEIFDQYIFGRDIVTVQSDHKPLEVIFKKSLLNAPKRLQRMLLWIALFSSVPIFVKLRKKTISSVRKFVIWGLPEHSLSQGDLSYEVFMLNWCN